MKHTLYRESIQASAVAGIHCSILSLLAHHKPMQICKWAEHTLKGGNDRLKFHCGFLAHIVAGWSMKSKVMNKPYPTVITNIPKMHPHMSSSNLRRYFASYSKGSDQQNDVVSTIVKDVILRILSGLFLYFLVLDDWIGHYYNHIIGFRDGNFVRSLVFLLLCRCHGG